MAKNKDAAKSAEAYRQERKERLAKSAKKNSKKAYRIDAPKMSKGAKAGIAIAVIAVIAIGAAFGGMYYFGVFERMKTVATVNGTDISAAEFEYYYKYIHNQYYSMSSQYDNYYGKGYGKAYTGYDYTAMPGEQQYVGDDFKLESGDTPSWEEYFEHLALESIKESVYFADEAKKNNFELKKSDLDEIDSQIEELRQSIYDNATNSEKEESTGVVVSLGTYLRSYYGRGMNEGLLRKIIKSQTVSQNYYQKILAEKETAYTEDQLLAEYNKDKSAYNMVDYRGFYIAAETPETDEDATEEEKTAATKKASEDAKKKADEMLGKITDSASFGKLAGEYATADQKKTYDYTLDETTLSKYALKSSITENISEDVAKWLFDAARKAGDKTVVDVNGTYAVLYLVKASYRDDVTMPVSVRHALFKFDDSLTEKTEINADAEKQKAAAQEAYDAWLAGDKSEDSFGAMAAEKSGDTSSANNGGLIENVIRGQMVKPFEEWCFDKDRKAGDSGIIETSYGYHVMYFVKTATEPYWKVTIRTTLAQKAYGDEMDKILASDQYKVDSNAPALLKLKDSIIAEFKNTYYNQTTTAAA